MTNSRLDVVNNSKLDVGIIDSTGNFHSDYSNFTKTHQLQYVSVSSKVPGCLGLDLEKVSCTGFFFWESHYTANSPNPLVRIRRMSV